MDRLISENDRFIAVIEYDDYPVNPREEYDQVGTIVYHSRQYCLGDEDIAPEDFVLPDNCVALPVYAMIHGDVYLSAGSNPYSALDPQGWDSGQSGVIYADRTRAREVFGLTTDAQIEHALVSEVREFSAYLNGDVYLATIYRVPDDADPNAVELAECEELDSCGGFYGYDAAREFAESELAGYEKSEPLWLDLPLAD